MIYIGGGLVTAVLLIWAPAVYSADVIPNDKDNYQGDRISFALDLHDITSRSDSAVKICIPARTSLRVVGTYRGATAEDEGLIVTFISDPTKVNCAKSKTGEVSGSLGEPYLLKKNILSDTPPNRFGLSFGVLAIPFKYHLTGNHNFSGSATVGGYIGRRFDRSSTAGYSIEPVLFGGLSNISVSQSTGGQGSTQDISGFTYGLGLVGMIKGNFQVGVVLGWDRVGKSTQYEYNQKPWLAIEIGYSFLQ